MITELTRDMAKQIDVIIEHYEKHKNKDKVLKELEPFRFPDGSLSLYIRDALSQAKL